MPKPTDDPRAALPPQGIDLRDWFAGMAMSALVDRYAIADAEDGWARSELIRVAVSTAYEISNLMVQQRHVLADYLDATRARDDE